MGLTETYEKALQIRDVQIQEMEEYISVLEGQIKTQEKIITELEKMVKLAEHQRQKYADLIQKILEETE